MQTLQETGNWKRVDEENSSTKMNQGGTWVYSKINFGKMLWLYSTAKLNLIIEKWMDKWKLKQIIDKRIVRQTANLMF